MKKRRKKRRLKGFPTGGLEMMVWDDEDDDADGV
jgi:hypothetical protein